MWIVGERYNVTTILLDLRTWTTSQGPDMPAPLIWMCALKVNATHAYIGGGETYGTSWTNFLRVFCL